jgi:tellurite resistance protein
MLVALAILPYNRTVAMIFAAVGAIGQLVFSVYRTGALWTGGRDAFATTLVLYLPTVAGNFVSANVASAFGLDDMAAIFFGAGPMAWLVSNRFLVDAEALRACGLAVALPQLSESSLRRQ